MIDPTLPKHIDLLEITRGRHGKSHGRLLCKHCHEKETDLPNKQDFPIEYIKVIDRFLKLHENCKTTYSLRPKNEFGKVSKDYGYNADIRGNLIYSDGETKFSFEKVARIIRLQINDSHEWNVIYNTTPIRKIPCDQFISLFHYRMSEREILDYKYYH